MEGQGGVTLSSVCPLCHRFPREGYIWWVSTGPGDGSKSKKKRHCSWWCAVCGSKYEWRDPNRVLVIQDRADPSEAKVFRAHGPPQGACGNLMSALKLLANQQTGGNSLLDTIFEAQDEKSRMS